MPDHPEQPVILDLAALPREQIGPFLLLGVDKDAGPDEIEAHWAQRLIWARSKQIRNALEDVNWAKEVLADRDRRVLADVTSMNPDTLSGELRQLLEKHGPLEPEVPQWTPFEAALPELPGRPPDFVPDPETIRAGLTVPEIPLELPAVQRLLDEVTSAPVDPWELGPLPEASPEEFHVR
jgi:hypothetical protein